MSGASAIGGFAEGLGSGLTLGKDLRAARQREKVMDEIIRRAETEGATDRGALDDWAAENGLLDTTSESALPDPVGLRFGRWIGGKMGLGKKESVELDPTPELDPAVYNYQLSEARAMPEDPTDEAVPLANGGYLRRMADGGDLDPEEVKKRAAENRARNPGRVSGTQTVVNDTTKGGKPSALKYEGVGVDKMGGVDKYTGKVARGAARAYGAVKGSVLGYLAGQSGAGALDAYNTPTDEMAGELGINYEKDRPGPVVGPWGGALPFLYDAGIRTAGTMKRVGDKILMRGDEEASAPAAPPAPSAPRPAPAQRTGSGLPPGGHNRKPSVPVKSAVEEAADPGYIDPTKVRAMDIPNFSTQDWSKYRKWGVAQMLARGTPMSEAVQKVDAQVIGIQQQGFMHYLAQAQALIGRDNNAAGAAVKAAFQYLPTTSDIKVGEYNGHLVVFGVDEDTGEQVGKPVVVNNELLTQVRQNFQNPMVWAEYAQDREEFKQKVREYEEVTKPVAENLMQTRNDAVVADTIRALGGADSGGSGGVKAVDLERIPFGDSAKQLLAELEIVDEDGSVASALAALMQDEYRVSLANGVTNGSEAVLTRARRLLARPDALELLQKYSAQR